MPTIVLTTLNARYAHASLGLRYLLANLGPLAGQAVIREFVVGIRPESLVERLLGDSPRIVAFGVYIWNVEQTRRTIAILRQVRPETIVVVGGPEVSHEIDGQAITDVADYIVAGPGEAPFRRLCERLVDWFEGRGARPAERVLRGSSPAVDGVELPYSLYDDEDIAHRNLYVEASRGCPYRCEFCLSALDRTAVPFDTDRVLDALSALHRRGARRFKFVDRTFNLRIDACERILSFLLDCNARTPGDPVFAHFELVPDRLPERLRRPIAEFGPGALQFEIGIQTWNPVVQGLVSRRQNNDAAEANIRWLRAHSHAHLHVDLIAGLPGETLTEFAAGFDRLVGLRPHEIQIGILKRLRGAPIARHTRAFELRFNPDPPYNLLASSALPFAEVREIERIARYWDLVANSGRFPSLTALLLGDSPFERLRRFSAWLHARLDATERIAPPVLHSALSRWLCDEGLVDPARVEEASRADRSGDGATARDAGRRMGAGDRKPRGAAPPRQRRFVQHGDATR